tara:strand:+ start:175 stop:786 length:612 start_codon:yes stop_codon:yes gene_type:complete
MVSQLKVNEIIKQSGSSISIGESGDTVNITSGATLDIPSGATIANAGTSTGFTTDVNKPYFSAHGSSTQTVATSTDTLLQFNQLLNSADSASGYDTSAYTYTVQSGGAGLWFLKAGFYFSGASSFSEGNQVQIKLQVDSNDKINSHVFYGGQTDGWISCNGFITLAVGNVIKLNTWQNTGGNITVYNNNNYTSQLSGFRIKTT